MNWLESLLYGLISGVTEFLPISTLAHQRILLKLFGKTSADPLQDLFVHLALLAALMVGCRNLIEQLRRGQHLRSNSRRGIRGNGDILELRFLKNAVLPMYIAYFILLKCATISDSLMWIVLFSIGNAAMLFFSSRMMRGNKDERSVSYFDSLFVGLAGALSVFPGVSRVAAMLAATTARGIGNRKSVNWILLLSAPAMLLLAIIDILNIISASGRALIGGNAFGYIFSALGAYVAGYIGISLMRSLVSSKDHSGFSFYALGVALFALFLYLSVV